MLPTVFKLCVAGALVQSLLAVGVAGAGFLSKNELRAKQLEAAERYHQARAPSAVQGHTLAVRPQLTFANPKAAEFLVDGAKIPDVDFDVGPSYAGLLPISGNANETRKLWFWFFPPGPQGSSDDLIFWTNGGPGCSSLEGLFQENGPVTWSWGQAKPTKNEWSWTNLSSVIWVEQPVGTGYSQGVPNIKDEHDLAAQLVGFLQQFLNVFSELKGKKFYLSGESYAGQYIPYIADYIYGNPKSLDLKLQGIWMGDPLFADWVIQQQIPAADYLHKFENVFALNQTTVKKIDATAKKCGYAGYMDKYVTYPPKGPLPLPNHTVNVTTECDVWTAIFDAALIINPAFNVYRIFDTYPILWDVLGFPGSFPQEQSPIYFDRPEVKRALHAPENFTWEECSSDDVFPNGDASPPSVHKILPGVIAKSTRSVIIHGLADFILIADGSRIAIQNMTWNGKQGFQKPIPTDSFLVDGIGAMGSAHTERGLTYIEVVLSGHMIPQFSPVAAFQSMQYLMGFRNSP
ncbi:alpha/beta-hydrolase [Ephemerocybe angulata]|uniref:Carboxypeptidase n=1 Tax=Ephemerocybe angulata TaxID=980116 RepID=A0A8H6LW95_9AGAR|nr:alpha/beta-hydrolase [Tulosesus angulatus]